MSAELDLTGRVAVVTGGASGLGAAIVNRLAAAGATVIAADLDIPTSGTPPTPGTVHRRLDVRSSAQHDALVAWVERTHGHLDIWINNAGIYPYGEAVHIDDVGWSEVLTVNLDGTFYGARAAARSMLRRGRGVIVNLGSVSGERVAAPGRAHYATSKAGVASLTRALARELGPQGVRVLCVAPSAVRTTGAQARSAAAGPGETKDPLAGYAATLPLRRIAEPDEVAAVVHFCASDLASFMTGTTVHVDGGQGVG